MIKIKRQFKNLTKAELAAKVGELSWQLIQARTDKVLGKLKNLRLIFNLRKAIAVAKTYESNSG